jgi:CP family cyanate transporter-like MFS transporter
VTPPGPPVRHAYRWVIFGAMCAVYFAFGVVLLAIPPMAADVRTDLGISRSVLGFALGAWALLYIVTAPPAGRIIDRLGLRRSLTAGSLLIAISAAVQAGARDGAMLWLAIGIIGIGGPLVSLSAPKLVADWFTDARERALAVGFYTSAPAIGGLFALALTNSVLLPVLGGWRSVLLFEAAMNLLAAVAWVVVSGRAPTAPSGAAPPGPSSPRAWSATKQLLAGSGVRLAMVLGIGSFFITQGLSAWLPDMLEEHSGLSGGAASTWAAVSLGVGIAARLAVPGLARPERRSVVLHGVMAALAVAMVVMAFGPFAVQVPAALVIGFRSTLNSLVIVVLMESDQVTPANAGLAYGLWFSAVEIGGAAGPPLVGAFGDSQVGYPGALVAMAAVLAVMIAALLRADRTSGVERHS